MSPDSEYARQSRWTDPKSFAGALLDVATVVPEELANVVSGLILHPGLARMRGIAMPPAAEGDQDLRSMSELLEVVLSRNPSALNEKRLPKDRLFGVCRHYALTAAAILRSKGIPARLRAGFANYFTPGWAEDHWVCEYHNGAEWKLLDPELGDTTRRQLGVQFLAHDVPRDRFLSASRVWQGVRNDKLNSAKVGIQSLGIQGPWFVAGSLLRDLAALTMNEMQAWDVWGPTRDLEQDRPIDHYWLARFDELAESLVKEPQSIERARQVVEAYPWAALGNSVLSYRLAPVEVSLE